MTSVIEDDNLWLTQKSVADLFDCEPNNVSYNINQIYSSNKLDEKSTYQIFRIVQKEGNREVERNTKILSANYKTYSNRLGLLWGLFLCL